MAEYVLKITITIRISAPPPPAAGAGTPEDKPCHERAA